MTMRSWYMPKASADRLAGLVDDVHFATRLPKNLIMGAVVNVIDRHRAEVEAEARSVAGQSRGPGGGGAPAPGRGSAHGGSRGIARGDVELTED
jgi:hypothetical protein